MASRVVRRQMLIVALSEGFAEMLWLQDFKDNDEHNSVFASMRRKLRDACDHAIKVLAAEPNGLLDPKEMRRIKKGVEDFKTKAFNQGSFEPMQAVAFVSDLISNQLVTIKRKAKNWKSKKYFAFDALLGCVQEFERFFDPEQKYEEIEGFEAARVFETIEV